MIVGRLSKKVVTKLTEIQYGFRKCNSTKQAILAIRTLIRKPLDWRHPIDLVFVDITMAFDSVPQRKLHEEPKGTI